MRLSSLLTLSDVEIAARRALDATVWTYVAGGAGDEAAVRGNRAAFQDVWLRPRAFGAAAPEPDTGVTMLGGRLRLPVLLAPTSPQRLLHADAELATARAAAAAGTVSIVSTDSHYPFPDIAAAGDKRCWFQLYPYESMAMVDAAVAMAEEAGAQALVVTVDADHPARRISARRAGFRTPSDVDFGTLRLLGVFDGQVPAHGRLDRRGLTWSDLDRIRGRCTVPLLVKGILRGDDARQCIDAGADGVVVSNHGGRQLAAAVPSLVALADIAPQVRADCVLLVDGGIRSGVDVVRAMALGAHAVCIGRPYLWGLGLAGQAGVESVLTLLREEIADTLRQLGLSAMDDVDADCLAGARRPVLEGRQP
jgi:4-hydroxymandelate oxidase